jgi:hypothetical protein
MQKQEREAAEVVAVKMGQKDGINTRRVYPLTLHRDEGRSPEVEEKTCFDEVDVDARLEPSTTTERISGSKKPHHDFAHRYSDAVDPRRVAFNESQPLRGGRPDKTGIGLGRKNCLLSRSWTRFYLSAPSGWCGTPKSSKTLNTNRAGHCATPPPKARATAAASSSSSRLAPSSAALLTWYSIQP